MNKVGEPLRMIFIISLKPQHIWTYTCINMQDHCAHTWRWKQIKRKDKFSTKWELPYKFILETKKAISYVVKIANSSVKCIHVFRDFFLGGSNHLGENKTSSLHLLKKLFFRLIFGLLNAVIWEEYQNLVLGVLCCSMECDTSSIICKD